METDREILCWFHQRLVYLHKESPLYDYMHRLRWIIQSMDNKKTSRGQKINETCNNTKELLTLLKKPSKFEQELLKED